MRVYLDNCCYNRPFDEQAQLKVRLETVTKLAVQLLMATRVVEYVWPKALDYEISFNPFPKRKVSILWWKDGAAEYVETTEEIIRRGEEIERFGVKPKDALHIAIAAVEGMDYLVSWNFRHITNAQMIPRIKKVCADSGYVCAEICTPQMLQEEMQDEA